VMEESRDAASRASSDTEACSDWVEPFRKQVLELLESLYLLGYVTGYEAGPGDTSWAAGYFVLQLQQPTDLQATERLRQDDPLAPRPQLAATMLGSLLRSWGLEYKVNSYIFQGTRQPWASTASSDNNSIPPVVVLEFNLVDRCPK
ncbi:hypothetical protein CYMTET_31194, partial [Cymbomonas tetramitiformis]